MSACALLCGLTLFAQFGEREQIFPQFAVGGVAESHFTIHNPGTQDITVDVELYLSDSSLFDDRQVEVPAGGTVTEEFSDPEGDLAVGWARLSASEPFSASLFYRIEGVGNVGVSPSPRTMRMKVFNFVEDGASTGFAVANPDETRRSDVSYRGVDVDGNQFISGQFSLGPGEHRAFFFNQAPTSVGSNGSVELEASSPVVALALRLDDSLLAGTPVVLQSLPIRGDFNQVSPNLIGGHQDNALSDGIVGATISGGGLRGELVDADMFFSFGPCPNCVNRVTNNYGAVGGGLDNQAGLFATVSGGLSNQARGRGGTVSGGEDNEARAWWSTIAGGAGNNTAQAFATVSGGSLNSAEGDSSSVGGGGSNVASGAWSAVGGGFNNRASGFISTVAGGSDNQAIGNFSFAAGYRALAAADGSFVFADSTDTDFGTLIPNSFWVQASGGTRFYSNADATAGVRLEPGDGSWRSISDRDTKENFQQVDGRLLLERLSEVPITTWNYKTQNNRIRHMGPTAQDFYAAFGLGDDRTIGTLDADGVALAAIQGLYQLIQEQAQRIEQLQQRLSQLEARLDASW